MTSTNLFYYNPSLIEATNRLLEFDICIYGGNAVGVIAAVQASRMGLQAILLEPGNHLGA